MKIRVATFDDIPAILGMGRRFHSKTEYAAFAPFDEETVTNKLADIISGNGVVFVAEEQEPIGMLGAVLTTAWLSTAPITVELFWWVEEHARRSGAGKVLLDALEAWWPRRSMALFMLATNDIAPATMERLYRIRKFTPSDRYYVKVKEA